MKSFRKLCLFLAVIGITAALFQGCSANSNEPVDINLPGWETTIDSDDLLGVKLRYALCRATVYGDTKAVNNFGYTPNTTYADLALARVDAVEKKYNCHIETYYASDGANCDDFVTQVQVGINYCDLIQSTSEKLITPAKIGLLASIDEDLESVIDWRNSAKWGDFNLLESICFNDHLYGVAPCAWPELAFTLVSYPIVFNEKGVKNAGLGDLREYMEKGEWTWNTFHTVLQSLTSDNGGTKTHAMSVHLQYLGDMTLRSNGANYLVSDGEGGYTCGYYTPQGVKACDELFDLVHGTYAECFKTNDDAPDDIVQYFVDGNSLMTACDTEHIYGTNAKISKNVEEFGILKWPTGPDVSPDYIFALHEANRYTICFPTTSDYNEEAALVVNAIYEPFEEYPDLQTILDYMKTYFFFDDRDADTFLSLYKVSRYNYFIQGGRKLPEELVKKTCKGVTHTMEINKDGFQKTIDEDVTNIASSAEKLFGQHY